MEGELNSQQNNTLPGGWTDGELNGQHKNNLPKEWTGGELIDSSNGWRLKK